MSGRLYGPGLLPQLLAAIQATRRLGVQIIAGAGIFRNQDLMGILVSIFIHPIDPFQDADIELVKGLADQAAVSITNANLFRQVRSGREHQRRLAKSIVDVQDEERRHIAGE